MLANWQFYALASAFFAALTAIFGKLGVGGLNSNFATLVRTLVILAVTTLLVTFRREWQWAELVGSGSRSFFFLVLSGVATGASWLFYYRALQLGDASQVAPLDKLSLVLVVILAVIFLGERPSLPTLLGAALIFAGTMVMVLGKA